VCHEEPFPGTEVSLFGQEGIFGAGFIARYGSKKMVSLKIFVVAYKILFLTRHIKYLGI
jgi:hypothetical protein